MILWKEFPASSFSRRPSDCGQRGGWPNHPGVELRANLKPISYRCHLFEVDRRGGICMGVDLETIHLPLGCLQGGVRIVFRIAEFFLDTLTPHRAGSLSRAIRSSAQERLHQTTVNPQPSAGARHYRGLVEDHGMPLEGPRAIWSRCRPVAPLPPAAFTQGPASPSLGQKSPRDWHRRDSVGAGCRGGGSPTVCPPRAGTAAGEENKEVA